MHLYLRLYVPYMFMEFSTVVCINVIITILCIHIIYYFNEAIHKCHLWSNSGLLVGFTSRDLPSQQSGIKLPDVFWTVVAWIGVMQHNNKYCIQVEWHKPDQNNAMNMDWWVVDNFFMHIKLAHNIKWILGQNYRLLPPKIGQLKAGFGQNFLEPSITNWPIIFFQLFCQSTTLKSHLSYPRHVRSLVWSITVLIQHGKR